VEFSLYAPNADTVKVRIKDEADHAMTRSDDGIWRATVGLASPVGKKYKYLVTNEDWTDKAATDPYNLARSWEDWGRLRLVHHIVDRNAYAWGDASWMAQTKPSLDELVIYELHIKDFSSHASAVHGQRGDGGEPGKVRRPHRIHSLLAGIGSERGGAHAALRIQ
jgi:maltooligosyltrehalose trehalohydrolase